nr:MAG TPA: Metalloprotease stcE [Caudoviricetes sp.]
MAYASPTIMTLSDGKWAPSFLLPAQMLKKQS